MNKRAAVRTLFWLLLTSPCAVAETYTQAWDRWADGATTDYWQRIVKSLQTDNVYERFERVTVRVVHHDQFSAECRQQSNIALSYGEGKGYVIPVCARQARFMLHFLDSLTTVFLDSDLQADGSSRALAATQFLSKQMTFTQAYEDHIIKALILEIDKGPGKVGDPDFVFYQCGSDFSKCF